MKVNKTQFIIIRVTTEEKNEIVSRAEKAKRRLSSFVRKMLGFK